MVTLALLVPLTIFKLCLLLEFSLSAIRSILTTRSPRASTAALGNRCNYGRPFSLADFVAGGAPQRRASGSVAREFLERCCELSAASLPSAARRFPVSPCGSLRPRLFSSRCSPWSWSWWRWAFNQRPPRAQVLPQGCATDLARVLSSVAGPARRGGSADARWRNCATKRKSLAAEGLPDSTGNVAATRVLPIAKASTWPASSPAVPPAGGGQAASRQAAPQSTEVTVARLAGAIIECCPSCCLCAM